MMKKNKHGATQEEAQQLAVESSHADSTSKSEFLYMSKTLAAPPDWSQFPSFVDRGMMPTMMVLTQPKNALTEKIQYFNQPGVAKQMLNCLSAQNCPQPVKTYIVTFLYDLLRGAPDAHETLVQQSTPNNLYTLFTEFVKAYPIQAQPNSKAHFFFTNRAASILAGCMTYARKPFHDVIFSYTQYVFKEEKLDALGKLMALSFLLQNESLNSTFLDLPANEDFLRRNLLSGTPATVLYKSVFCVWLLTFNESVIPKLVSRSEKRSNGLMHYVILVLKDAKMEKLIRVCVAALTNLVHNENLIEMAIENETVQTLTLLEYEKFRDADLYTAIRDLLNQLNVEIRKLSNFDRYCRELDSRNLKWSFLHSDKFWHENVRNFENHEYRAIRQLTDLISGKNEIKFAVNEFSHSPSDLKASPKVDKNWTRPEHVSICVACHDLGEFARLHGSGKRILQDFRTKEAIVALINDENRDIAREALLACQKLMLQKWDKVKT